jgi:hypothetical protein
MAKSVPTPAPRPAPAPAAPVSPANWCPRPSAGPAPLRIVIRAPW